MVLIINKDSVVNKGRNYIQWTNDSYSSSWTDFSYYESLEDYGDEIFQGEIKYKSIVSGYSLSIAYSRPL